MESKELKFPNPEENQDTEEKPKKSSLEDFCERNPWAPECIIYDV